MKSPDAKRQSAPVLDDCGGFHVGSYSDAQWQRIHASLRAVGIDLDTATVDADALNSALPYRSPPAHERQLGGVLQVLAWHFAAIAGLSNLTPPPTARRAQAGTGARDRSKGAGVNSGIERNLTHAAKRRFIRLQAELDDRFHESCQLS